MIKINDINLQNNEVEIIEKADKYAVNGISKKIHIPNMAELTHSFLKGILENELETNYGYVNEPDVWHEPSWNYRVFVKSEDLATILSKPAYASLIQSFITAPINPCYKLSEGCLYYMNSKDQNMINSLAQINIEIDIEDKF